MAITFVQQAPVISGTAATATFGAITVTAGSLLVVLQGGGTATDTSTTPTDNSAAFDALTNVDMVGNIDLVTANVWSKAVSVDLSSVPLTSAAIWYAPNANAGSTTVTINFSGSTFYRAVLCEFSGIAPSSPLDKTASSSSASAATPQTGTTAVVSRSDTLAIGMVRASSIGALTAIGGTVGTWNALSTGAGVTTTLASYDIGASIGTFGAQGSASAAYIGVVATFAGAIVAGVPRRRRPKPRPKPLLRKRKPARRVFDGSLVLSPVPPHRKRLKIVPKKAPPRRKFHPFRFSQFVVAALLAMVPKRPKPLRYPLVLQANRPPRRLQFPRRLVDAIGAIYTESLSATNTTTGSVSLVVSLIKSTANTTVGTVKQFVQQAVSVTMGTTGAIAQLIQQVVSATNTTTATVDLRQLFGFVLSATNTTTATVRQFLARTFVATNTTTAQVVKSIQKTLRANNVTSAVASIKALRTFLITLTAHVITTALAFTGITPVIKQYTIKVTKVTSVIGIAVTDVRKAS